MSKPVTRKSKTLLTPTPRRKNAVAPDRRLADIAAELKSIQDTIAPDQSTKDALDGIVTRLTALSQ